MQQAQRTFVFFVVKESDVSEQAPQLGPPQSTPSSAPFRTPSSQDVKALGMNTHADPTRMWPQAQS
jgi:hypothetical protein